ncbi:MAG TPA: hypothetical protein VKC90_01475 [Chitinophagaceae bacterium]|nr:hypothetical protein [Chitinophagaceae bacterium]
MESCQASTGNPTGHSYTSDSIITINYSKKLCGLLPFNKKNYWVYEDSVFDDGTFIKTQYDTLRFTATFISLPDSLVWWETSISVGLPEMIYANDSSFFEINERLFAPEIIDVKKEFGLFEGDSIRYLTSFEDIAAMGRSVKMEGVIKTPAGDFDDCILFEKNARNYRRDQVYFKPGLGVIRYILEKAVAGSPQIKLQQISTLVSFHFE